MALEEIKPLAWMLEKSIIFGSSFNHQMAPSNLVFLSPLCKFKNQNCKISSFLASNSQNLLPYDEMNWIFEVLPFKNLKIAIFPKSLIFTK